MKNLFDPALAQDVKHRILRLDPESERQWGSMALPQTLAHCTCGLHMAMGAINPKRERFPVSAIGWLIRPLVFRDDKPLRRNSPSIPDLFPANPVLSDFERERTQLIDAINSFTAKGAACCSRHPHPFFGPLQPEQWSILMYKHLDHHLRQFGA